MKVVLATIFYIAFHVNRRNAEEAVRLGRSTYPGAAVLWPVYLVGSNPALVIR